MTTAQCPWQIIADSGPGLIIRMNESIAVGTDGPDTIMTMDLTEARAFITDFNDAIMKMLASDC